MFLATKEIKNNKGRYVLIVTIIILISYLVYFLCSLAYGLASSYSNGINKINSDIILLHENSNSNMMMSVLTDELYNEVEVKGTKAKLGLFPAIILKTNEDEVINESKEDVFIFGIDDYDFFLPGERINLNDNEVIIDESIKKLGYKIGDTITTTDSSISWIIKGFTKKATYQTAPIVYISLKNWQEYRYGSNTSNYNIFNAIFIKGKITNNNEFFEELTTNSYIFTLPGYSAQVLTFSLMIGFLILIMAIVLGIFIYVLTIQKTSIFGVLKAQGISSFYIGKSVVIQTLVLTITGIIIGFLLTQLSGFFLKGLVPFANNILFIVTISFLFIIFSILGSLFSFKAVVKIDPVKAIG